MSEDANCVPQIHYVVKNYLRNVAEKMLPAATLVQRSWGMRQPGRL